jgi:hypothetical protein
MLKLPRVPRLIVKEGLVLRCESIAGCQLVTDRCGSSFQQVEHICLIDTAASGKYHKQQHQENTITVLGIDMLWSACTD